MEGSDGASCEASRGAAADDAARGESACRDEPEGRGIGAAVVPQSADFLAGGLGRRLTSFGNGTAAGVAIRMGIENARWLGRGRRSHVQLQRLSGKPSCDDHHLSYSLRATHSCT